MGVGIYVDLFRCFLHTLFQVQTLEGQLHVGAVAAAIYHRRVLRVIAQLLLADAPVEGGRNEVVVKTEGVHEVYAEVVAQLLAHIVGRDDATQTVGKTTVFGASVNHIHHHLSLVLGARSIGGVVAVEFSSLAAPFPSLLEQVLEYVLYLLAYAV